MVADGAPVIHRAAAIALVLLLLARPQCAAQIVGSFEDLALRVNLDDRLQVEDQAGIMATGRLIRLTRDEIAIETEAGEQRFTSETVRRVAMRAHSLRKGALIGAGVGAALGTLATCVHEGGGDCFVIGSLGAAPIGAGVGLAIAALFSGMRTVYRAQESRATIQGPHVTSPVQTSFLDDLALRVNLGDQLRITSESGIVTTGRLTRLTADEVTVQNDAGETRFVRESIRQIAVRQRPLRTAVLIGAGSGWAAGAVAACIGPNREECVDAPIMSAALGAGVGLAVGALVHKTTTVYPEVEKRTSILPVISRDALGVQVRRSW
jgi:hypothetical protein